MAIFSMISYLSLLKKQLVWRAPETKCKKGTAAAVDQESELVGLVAASSKGVYD